MTANKIPLFALHGESHTVPKDTIVSYWAALGSGANGIVASLQITKDGAIVCCPDEELNVSKMLTREVLEYDAGAKFHSAVLNNENQPTGDVGLDTPWACDATHKPHIYHPKLEEVLQLFGRRTKLMLYISPKLSDQLWPEIVKTTINLLKKYALHQQITMIASERVVSAAKTQLPELKLALISAPNLTVADNIDIALKVSASFLYLDVEQLCKTPVAITANSPVKFLLSPSPNMPFAPTPAAYQKIVEHQNIEALIMRSITRTRDLVTSPAIIFEDNFGGTEINRQLWACGYSHINQDTNLSQNNGFIITIQEGGEYSGGAAVSIIPLHGDFDAQVCFSVANPKHGTTFEMAAISIDPGYFHIKNTDLNTRNVNLTFDVHGAPPYASSERDECDGFRIGWNNGYNLTQIDKQWKAASANMYNKYGRDVGNGDKDNPTGMLRLVHAGSVFNAYYKDKYNKEWVCSGSALVSNMGSDVHIRLGAKHWPKGGETPPHNKIVFSNFQLRQFQ